MISRRTTVSPEDSEAECPLWLSVVERAARGDESMRAYLQRVAGYLATGETKEEVFFFIYGPGASGKSTFVRVLNEILGDYAQAASMEAFMHRDRPEHSTEIARMAGARIVCATETDEGARLNESRIKALTGRDKIAARFMRGDLFDFTPTAKCVLVGNHKPQLRSVGEEMKRRIHIIDFPESIPEEDRDRDLPEKLRAEYPAILRWIIAGARSWLDCGLGKPERVEDATRDYLAGEDTMGAWLEERTAAEDGTRTPSGDAYRDYKGWSERGGEYVISQKRFVQRLMDRGFRTIKSGVRYIEGLRLRESGPPRADPYG
jgi:putative DNA primase/helicase